MKYISKIIYALVIFLVGVIVYRVTTINIKKNYYQEVGVKQLEEGLKADYMNTFIETENIDSYISKPIYNAVSKDELLPFNLSIYFAKSKSVSTSNNSLLLFYFDDRNIDNLNESIDYSSMATNKDAYSKNSDLMIVRLNVYMDNNVLPTTNFYFTELNKRAPIGLIGFHLNDSGEVNYDYYQMKDKNDKKPNRVFAKKITKIELVIEDYTTNKLNDPITTSLAVFNHNDNIILPSEDILVNNDNIITTDKFNGSLDSFYKEDVYVNNISEVYTSHGEMFNKYNYKVYINMIVWGFISMILTYLVYFLVPTINYFKYRKKI